MTGILAVVRQPQPLSSWGWDAIEKVKASMGAGFAAELEKLARNAAAPANDRVRALLEMQRHGGAPNAALLQALIKNRSADVRAAAAYVVGLHSSDAAKAVAASGLKDANGLVQRRAAEAIVRMGLKPSAPSFAPIADIYALLRSTDRFVRYSGRVALEHTPRQEWSKLVMAETNLTALTEGLVALANTAPEAQAQSELRPVFEKLITLMQRTGLTPDEKIRVLRALEVAVSQTPQGLDAALKKQIHAALIKQFPAAAPAGTWVACTNRTAPAAQCAQFMLTHHLAKVLSYTGEPDVIGKVLAVMPKGDDDQPGQIDYMYSLRVIDSGWTSAQKEQAIDWFARASKWRGGSTFAGQVNNIFDATIDTFSEDEKQVAYKAAPLFAPITEDIAAAPPAAAAGPGRAGPGARGRGPSVPLDRQERYDNLVFPRGGGPGSLAGRGGAPNPAEGERVFRETCAQCHRFGTLGKDYAPDLTKVADRMPRRDILRSIFFPQEKVDPKYLTTVITTKDGKTLRGLVVSETGPNVSLKTAADPEPLAIAKAQIARRATEPTSIMPADIADQVTDNGVRDVTAYVMRTMK
jgi:putative heme-binding domain-containing protein